MDRLACVDLPALPLQVLRRLHPEWAAAPDAPTAVVAEDRPQAPLLWVDAAARTFGIRTGMRYAAALSLSSRLRAAPVPPEALAGCLDELAGRLRRFTPHVEPAPGRPGCFWLDAGGLGGLFPSVSAWARAVHGELAGAGYDAVVVVGFTRFGATAVARSLAAERSARRTLVFATTAAEDQAARRVQLDRLPIDPAARDTLERLGLRTVADLVALPSAGLVERFGAELGELHQEAAGRRVGALHPLRPVEPVEATLDFDFPEIRSGPVLAFAESALPDLVERLARRGEDLAGLVLERTLDRGQEPRTDALELAAPSRDFAAALELVRLRLESGAPLAAGVLAVRLTARGVHVPGEQPSLLALRPPRDRRAAERALARLRAEFGEDAVVTGAVREGHLPEGQFVWRRLEKLPPPPLPGTRTTRPAGAPRVLVRRILEKPREIPTPGVRDPAPWPLAGPSPGRTVRVDGPFLVEGGWWTGRPVQREYRFVQTLEGHLLWVYHDRLRRRWFLQGQVE